MPKTLRSGSSGSDVTLLQNTLNSRMPGVMPPLNPDGVFGSKTTARVKQFQLANGLMVDGVVGPMTWSALLSGATASGPAPIGCNCGVGDKANQGMGEFIKQMYIQAASVAAAFGVGAFDRASSTSGVALSGFGTTLSRILVSHVILADPFYGRSLDMMRIYFTTLTGAGGRPFTVAAPDPDGSGFVQIMNLGPAPDDATVIHELMHCWQSQHSPNPLQFMASAAANQGAAVARSGLAGLVDSSVKSHVDGNGNSDYPTQYPYSAYAYMPGSDLDAYGAEQAANAVEHKDPTVLATVKGTAKNTVSGANLTSLGMLTACGDRRIAGMIY